MRQLCAPATEHCVDVASARTYTCSVGQEYGICRLKSSVELSEKRALSRARSADNTCASKIRRRGECQIPQPIEQVGAPHEFAARGRDELMQQKRFLFLPRSGHLRRERIDLC